MQEARISQSSKDRYRELIMGLAELSEWELHTFCLNSSNLSVIQAVLDFKQRSNNNLTDSGINLALEERQVI